MRSLKIMPFSAWAGGRGEKGEGKHVRNSRFRVQTSGILLLNVLNSRLCFQCSTLPISLAGRHREKRHSKLESSQIPGDFHRRICMDLLPSFFLPSTPNLLLQYESQTLPKAALGARGMFFSSC